MATLSYTQINVLTLHTDVCILRVDRLIYILNTGERCVVMGYSRKRMKQLIEGKVQYCILDGDNIVYSSKSFVAAVQMADQLQKSNPGINYTMKLMEVPGDA